MTRNSTCIDPVSLKNTDSHRLYTDKHRHLRKSVLNKERMLKYKTLSVAFSYPDGNFFKFYPKTLERKEELLREYDRLFRANDVWLYSCEYIAENEFQRVQALADINGFYRAFGLETSCDRPDALTCELEFMHYLILKEMKAPDKEKRTICLDAQNKFFNEHLYLAGKKMLERVLSHTENNFYKEIAKQLLIFLDYEAKFLKTMV
jgi:TorA maturation chaperone TorD